MWLKSVLVGKLLLPEADGGFLSVSAIDVLLLLVASARRGRGLEALSWRWGKVDFAPVKLKQEPFLLGA